MRDHRKMQVFALADQLAVEIYAVTRQLPPEERFGLVSQLRRAAVSVAANIVEGAAHESDREFIRFLRIAYASACELEYELSLAVRLNLINGVRTGVTCDLASQTCRALRSMILKLRR